MTERAEGAGERNARSEIEGLRVSRRRPTRRQPSSSSLSRARTSLDDPVLDYSGGTGNNAIYLAKKGLRVQYFGIGMAEKAFARYRVERNGLQDLVEFKEPYTRRTGYTFDPINGPLPQDGSLGSILAMDVREHIPNYHKVVEKMVVSIRVGGLIIEHSPFGSEQESSDQGEPDLRVHVSTGGISMEEAMGPRMKKLNSGSYMNVWVKMMSK